MYFETKETIAGYNAIKVTQGTHNEIGDGYASVHYEVMIDGEKIEAETRLELLIAITRLEIFMMATEALEELELNSPSEDTY